MENARDSQTHGPWSYIFIFILGLVFIAITYGTYQEDAWLDEMSTHSPVVCMKIVSRIRGAGTVKYPCEIHADYQGRTYHFEMGSKSFRKMRGIDSIEACLDPDSGRAFLPITGRVKHYMGLYFLMGVGGAVLAGMSIRKLVRLARAVLSRKVN